MPDHNDQALREAMTRLLAGDGATHRRAPHRQQPRRRGRPHPPAGLPLASHPRLARGDGDPPPIEHPDKAQARIERLARDLAAAQQRAQRYRQERDEARDQARTLANACRVLDEENEALRAALADAHVVVPIRHRALPRLAEEPAARSDADR